MNEFLSLTGETREIKKDREEKKVCKSGVEKETNIDRVPYFSSYAAKNKRNCNMFTLLLGSHQAMPSSQPSSNSEAF